MQNGGKKKEDDNMQFQGFIIRNILKSKHWYEGYKISQYFKKWINSKENFKMSSRTRKKIIPYYHFMHVTSVSESWCLSLI